MSKLSNCLLYLKNPSPEFIEELKKKAHLPWFNVKLIIDLSRKTDKLLSNNMGIKLAREVEISPLKIP